MTDAAPAWDGARVRAWLQSRIAAARADQIEAERGGRGERDACDKAAAEEMVCIGLKDLPAVERQDACADAVRTLLAQEHYIWRGVWDDRRFDRHVRAYLRKLQKMIKDDSGFDNLRRFQ